MGDVPGGELRRSYHDRIAEVRQRTERIEKFDGPKLHKCPKCGGRVERMVSAPAIQFKGSGWYVTDYGKSSSAGSKSKESGSNEGSKSEGKSDGKSEGKSESKTEGKDSSSSSDKKKTAAKSK